MREISFEIVDKILSNMRKKYLEEVTKEGNILVKKLIPRNKK